MQIIPPSNLHQVVQNCKFYEIPILVRTLKSTAGGIKQLINWTGGGIIFHD